MRYDCMYIRSGRHYHGRAEECTWIYVRFRGQCVRYQSRDETTRTEGEHPASTDRSCNGVKTYEKRTTNRSDSPLKSVKVHVVALDAAPTKLAIRARAHGETWLPGTGGRLYLRILLLLWRQERR